MENLTGGPTGPGSPLSPCMHGFGGMISFKNKMIITKYTKDHEYINA